VSASVSTHVLDTGRGEPARGILVELFHGEELVATAVTDTDGRVADLAGNLDPGIYRMAFHPQTAFFSRVELEVALGDGHFHIPLLVSPYSCTTYRGS
jgi:5-hydroxyisourate hydrolase